MAISPKAFYRATNPTKALDPHDPTTAGYYIDFSEVRGGQIIEELRTAIAWAEATDYKCELFTGHIGCGKSTELLCLKEKLEADGFHVVYFVSDEDLDMGDAEITEILLAIARQVSESLEKDQTIKDNIAGTLQGAKKLLQSDVLKFNIETAEIPGIGKFGVGFDSTEENQDKLSLSGFIGSISTTTRKNRDMRDRLRDFLEPKSEKVIDVLNEGLFAPVGETIASASYDGTVRLWNRSGEELQVLRGHEDRVLSVSFSPDGETIASASDDGTVRLWNRSGDELQVLRGHEDRVWSVSFSPDGETIASASSDGTVRLWPVESLEDLLVRGCSWLEDYLLLYPDENKTDDGDILCEYPPS